MDRNDLVGTFNRFKFREETAHDLMKYRIHDILLVSTFYDAFIFEQDSVLAEQVLGDYRALDLSSPPRITNVPTATEALRVLQSRKMDLVITTLRVGEVSPFDLATQIKQAQPDLPVLLLLNNPVELSRLETHREQLAVFDEVFLWSGDNKVFLAMVKTIEDRKNLAEDTRNGMVRVILLVEDTVQYYSRFLPVLYAAVMRQTRQLIAEESSEIYRRMRMRLRPKIVLVHDFAAAQQVYREYRDNLLCIVTDVAYERAGRLDETAGVQFIAQVRADRCGIPVLIQSSDDRMANEAQRLNARFLHKDSPHLMQELQDFLLQELGFGDFVFRMQDGTELARAGTMVQFMALLRTVPDASLMFHAASNHYSAWLIAHGEVAYARKIEPLQISDFPGPAAIRDFLIGLFDEVEKARNRGRVVDVTAYEGAGRGQIVRLREGSLGGKGRSLAFLNALVHALDYEHRYPDVTVTLPATAIIGTQEWDDFLSKNALDASLTEQPDAAIREAFLAGELSPVLIARLQTLARQVHHPLAVRSSGLLEDSMVSPFAGVYKTYMLPNNHPDIEVRVQDLVMAIKLVFASVFERQGRDYIRGTNFALQDEKMAVIIQEMAGAPHGEHFYPDCSGVAQSHNFYPTGSMRPDEGIASIALGLGKLVMEGGHSLRFCPRRPAVDILSPGDLFGSSQKAFWALRLDAKAEALRQGEEGTLQRCDLALAESHQTLQHVASSWDFENNRLVDGLTRAGPRVVTFSNVLKYGTFPLPELLVDLLEIGETALGSPVEIEFAANLTRRPDRDKPEFFLLQIRPLNVSYQEVTVPEVRPGLDPLVLAWSCEALGNGVLTGLADIVYVDSNRFTPTETVAMRHEIAAINTELREQGRGYILIGPGRWGSRDRFLGVPVAWADISEARVLIEVDLPDFRVEASQGSHFFHNLVAMNVGYLKVRHDSPAGFVDWNWLHCQSAVRRTGHLVHVRLPEPCEVRLDGRSGRAVVRRGVVLSKDRR